MSGRPGWIVIAGVVTALVLAGLLAHESREPDSISSLAAVPSQPGPPPSLDGTGKVHVRVLSARDQKPLVGATVAVRKRGEDFPIDEPPELATTDGAGVARISSVPAGELTLCTRGARHQEYCEEYVGLVAGGTASRLLLPSPGASVHGQVFLPDGSPAEGVRLVAITRMFPPWPRMHTYAVTDFLGRYHLDGVTPGGSAILLFAPVAFPYLSESPYLRRTVEVAGGMDVQLDIHLRELIPVSVRPCSATTRGTALPSRIVSASLRGVWGEGSLTRQEDDSWTGRVEAGVYTAEGEAYSGTTRLRGEQTVDLRPGGPRVIPITCEQAADERTVLLNGFVPLPEPSGPESFEFAGHVLLPDGTPARGARITVDSPRFRPITRSCELVSAYRHVGFDGSGFVVHLPSHQRDVFAWLDNGLYGHVRLPDETGERVVADIHLKESTGAIVGRFDLLMDGTDVSAPRIYMRSGKDSPTYYPLTQFTWDGRFVVAGIPPGEHSVELAGGLVRERIVVQAGVATDLGYLPPAR